MISLKTHKCHALLDRANMMGFCTFLELQFFGEVLNKTVFNYNYFALKPIRATFNIKKSVERY